MMHILVLSSLSFSLAHLIFFLLIIYMKDKHTGFVSLYFKVGTCSYAI